MATSRCRALTTTTTRTKAVSGEPSLKKENAGTHINTHIARKKHKLPTVREEERLEQVNKAQDEIWEYNER